MGISYNSYYYFKFETDEDAADFSEAVPSRVKASHYFDDAPCHTRHCDDVGCQVLCHSDGYGTFDLTEFVHHNVVGCYVVVYECHTVDKAYAYWLDADEFTLENSAPSEENYERGIQMMSEESMPHYGEDMFDGYDKMCDGWLAFITNKFRLEVEMMREVG